MTRATPGSSDNLHSEVHMARVPESQRVRDALENAVVDGCLAVGSDQLWERILSSRLAQPA